MVNKVFNKENKKDKFIMDHLLPYLMRHIEEKNDDEEITEAIAAMFIFPYRTENGGVRLGSLKEPGINWYFAPQGDKKSLSAGSYRIVAESTLKSDQVKRLRQIFLDNGLIAEFSDAAVIKDLLRQMSEETDYTEYWWTCAYDIFKLWKPDAFNDNMTEATKSMNNNSFLFVPDYMGYRLKDDLVRHRVFKDIETPASKNLFWDKIPSSERKKAVMLLGKLGVPSSFIYKKSGWTSEGWSNAEYVNPYILRFAAAIGNDITFPVDNADEYYALCRLCHSLFMDVIYQESRKAFMDAATTDDEDNSYNAGIPVMNTTGEFVPLSWHLFYSSTELEDNDGEYENEEDEDGKEDNHGNTAFEFLHIDVSQYEAEFIQSYDNIHAFSEIYETADEYNIDDEETIDFYKWIWSYSKHSELADNILCYYSDDDNRRFTIDQEDNDFVLSVIDSYDGEDNGYCFDIDLRDNEAFLHADTVNKIHSLFEDIYAVIYSECQRLDVHEYVKRILDVTEASYTEKSKIEQDHIWEHVYLTSGETGMYDDIHVSGRLYHPTGDRHYEEAIFLWSSEDEDSYVRAIAKCIEENYEVDVAIAGAEAFDWKQEYIDLAKDIWQFISERTERRLPEDLYGYVAEMADVETFGQEKKIWSMMKNQRERILMHETGSIPVDLSYWRRFLSSKYTGRCQLCGGKTITGEQYAHFYTYRLVKPSKNNLADMYSNMFCLCPSCWGEMGQGDFMGKDMSELLNTASDYAEYLEAKLQTDEMEADFPSLVKEVWENQEFTEEEEEKLEGFHNPIVCRVMVNGKDRLMAFSWEHFMRIAFILSDAKRFKE